MFNPDGYEYSIDGDRMWRKTRTRIVGSQCVGIDPNRNFDVAFGGKYLRARVLRLYVFMTYVIIEHYIDNRFAMLLLEASK